MPQKINPIERIGETYTMTCGLKATIIEYNNSRNITIQFEDGVIKKNVAYHHFKKGLVTHPSNLFKNRIGETFIQKSGHIATIIDGINTHYVTVKFEDNTIRKNVQYRELKLGRVSHPKDTRKQSIEEHIGEISKTNDGKYEATIIGIDDKKQFIIQFKDGAIRNNIKYDLFKQGKFRHPKDKKKQSIKEHIGETSKTDDGKYEATIIDIDPNNKNNFIIQFKNGTIRNNINYTRFKQGKFKHPMDNKSKKSINIHIGETYTTSNKKHTATIIEAIDANHTTIQFEDGTIKKDVAYHNLKNHNFTHPLDKDTINNHIGQTFITPSGLKITIIDGNDKTHTTIQFEDGVKLYNKKYNQIKHTGHPYLTQNSKQFHSIKLNQRYRTQLKYISYNCTCEICGKNMLLTPYQLMQHHLKCQK